MATNKETVDRAVLKIFVDLGAGAGSCLLLNNLKSEWARARQNNEDLIEAVRRLIFTGVLDLAHTEAGTALTLTTLGRQRTGAMRHELRSIWNHMAAAAHIAAPSQTRRATVTG